MGLHWVALTDTIENKTSTLITHAQLNGHSFDFSNTHVIDKGNFLHKENIEIIKVESDKNSRPLPTPTAPPAAPPAPAAPPPASPPALPPTSPPASSSSSTSSLSSFF